MSERIAVIGVGRLGSCLVRALDHAGVCVRAVASARPDRASRLVEGLRSAPLLTTPQRAAAAADLIFLAVPDGQIAEVCRGLELGPGQAVVHASGALDLAPLTAASARGAGVGVFHPLQAFPQDAPIERLAGIAIGVDAEPPLFERLAGLGERLGARTFSLRGVDRARYHAAAVFASNYVVALHAVAARVWQAAGLSPSEARPALAALTHGAVDALSASELAQALTGPIARGDMTTISRHLSALQHDPDALELYRRLGHELLALPLQLSPARLAQLQIALSEPPDQENAAVSPADDGSAGAATDDRGDAQRS